MTDTKTAEQSSAMGELLEKEGAEFQFPKVGDLVAGRVLAIGKNEVVIDVAGITTGIVRGYELFDESGEYSELTVGHEVFTTVMEMENEQGVMELSFRAAGHLKAWSNLEELKKNAKVIDAPITDANRGGLMVRVGRIDGFLPVSQLIPEHYPRVDGGDKNKILEKLKSFIGQEFKVRVIDLDEQEEKLIVSERAAWENEQKKMLETYKVGDVVEGKITGVVHFGAFFEFGENLEGLIHISELAWQRIEDPRDIVHVGQTVKAQIIAIEGTKISLSMKRLMDDPWKDVEKQYPLGSKVKGTVLKLNAFGAFVELDKDIHGLAHISELSDKIIHHPSEVLKEGDEVKFRVVSIEPAQHRLGLSLKEKPSSETEHTPENATKAAAKAKKDTEEVKAEDAPVKKDDAEETKREEKKEPTDENE
ncbi:MAG: S1 RNA-binding domain-containing protein [Patescibacteria group bacterium]|jgi:small subunit ribosomal protein S1